MAPFFKTQLMAGFSCVWGLLRSVVISLVGVISGVLVCRIKDPFVVMQDPIAYLFCHDAST